MTEIDDVKQALTSFLNRFDSAADRDLYRYFLSRVLGYDEEVIPVPATEERVELPVEIDNNIKFLMCGADGRKADNWEEQAMWLALYHHTSLFVLLNFPWFRLYDVLQDRVVPKRDLVMEFPLAASEDVAFKLWSISRKDCGKKVLLHIE
ncbi:MAG: hypothetical protein ACE5GM_01875 [bacterium]